MSNMKIAIDADDAAFYLKDIIYNYLKSKGHDITDLYFANGNADVTYPEIGFNLAKKIQSGEFDRGFLICGTGLGMAIIANKVEGVYAGVCHDVYSAERLKKSNDANVLTMGARVVGSEHAKMICDAWLASQFAGGSSAKKVEIMRKLEKDSFQCKK